MTMRGSCERCHGGGPDQALHRQLYGIPVFWDRMVCARCLMLPPDFELPPRPEGCSRCGSFYELVACTVYLVDSDLGVEPIEERVALCGDCRNAAHRENTLRQHR